MHPYIFKALTVNLGSIPIMLLILKQNVMDNIIENNKLIAEFMGRNWEEIVEICKYEVYESGHRSDTIINDPEYWACYHSDWNWLMEALKKCMEVISNYEFDSEEYKKLMEDIFNIDFTFASLMNADIEDIYSRLVEFIKEYNKQNK